MEVPQSIADPISVKNNWNRILLMNTEAKFDTYLIGLEFYMACAQNIEFYVSVTIKTFKIHIDK